MVFVKPKCLFRSSNSRQQYISRDCARSNVTQKQFRYSLFVICYLPAAYCDSIASSVGFEVALSHSWRSPDSKTQKMTVPPTNIAKVSQNTPCHSSAVCDKENGQQLFNGFEEFQTKSDTKSESEISGFTGQNNFKCITVHFSLSKGYRYKYLPIITPIIISHARKLEKINFKLSVSCHQYFQVRI